MQENIAFSLWCDFIERDFLERDFTKMVQDGTINGATSNPAIFQQALLNTSYQTQKDSLQQEDKKSIYEALAKADIQRAAEILKPLYDNNPNDGYISMEVDPNLCHDAKATIEEGLRLFDAIGFPNVMIKVPATKAGFSAIEELIAQGVSVNATLVFSKQQMLHCLDALKRGYEQFKQVSKREPKDFPRAVVSVFVSRFDRKCDAMLKEHGIPTATLGIKNAQYLYHILNNYGLPGVRTLFASTGVKGEDLDPAYYIKELYHPYAINTAPISAIKAFNSNDTSKAYLPSPEELEEFLQNVQLAGINLESISQELLEQGLEDFKAAFSKILESL